MLMKNKILPKSIKKTLFALPIITLCALNSSKCYAKISDGKNDDYSSLHFFNDDVIKEMELIHQRMDEFFAKQRKQMMEDFKEIEKNHLSQNKTKISSKSDDDFYYYRLDFKGFKKENIIVEIKDNVLTFFAKKDEKSKKNYSQENFYYSLSLPKYDDSVSPDIERQDNNLTVKLKRIKEDKKKT